MRDMQRRIESQANDGNSLSSKSSEQFTWLAETRDGTAVALDGGSEALMDWIETLKDRTCGAVFSSTWMA
jgi:hypothetical protein